MANEKIFLKLEIDGSGNVTAELLKVAAAAEKSAKQIDHFEAAARKAADGAEWLNAKMGLVAVTAAGAFAYAFKTAIDHADELNKMSQKVGMSVEALSALEHAAKLSGVSMESLGKGIKGLSGNMVEAATKGGDAGKIFGALGIDVKAASGGLKSADQVLLELADRFAKMEGSTTKTTLAAKLFGESGRDLIPLMNAGSKGIKDMTDEAHRLGIVMTKETTQAAENFNDNLTRLRASSSALTNHLMTDALSAMNGITKAMIEAAKEGGILKAIWVGLGGLGMALYSDEFVSKTEKAKSTIKAMEENLAYLERKKGSPGPEIYGLDQRIAEAKAKVAKAKADLDAIINAPPAAKPETKKSPADDRVKRLLDGLSEGKDGVKAYQKELDALLGRLENNGGMVNAQFGQDLAMLHKEYAAGHMTIDKYRALVEKLIGDTEYAKNLAKESADAAKFQADGIKRLAEEEKKRNDELLKSVEADQKTLEALTRKNDLMEMGVVTVEEMAVAELQAKLASVDYANATWEEIDALEKRLDIAQRIVEQSKRGERIKPGQDEAKKAAEEWQRTADTIEKSLTDALMRGFEGGKDWARNFRDTLVNMFKTLVLRPIIQPIAQGASGMVMSAFGMSGTANASGGQGGTGGMSFNPMSFIGGNSIGMGFQGMGDWMFANTSLPTGGLMSAGMIPNWQFGVAGLGGGLVGSMFGGYGGVGGSLGASLGLAAGGPIGAAVGTALGGALGGLFGEDGPKHSREIVHGTKDASYYEDSTAYVDSVFGRYGYADAGTKYASGDALSKSLHAVAALDDRLASTFRLTGDQITSITERLATSSTSYMAEEMNDADAVAKLYREHAAAVFDEIGSGLGDLVRAAEGDANAIAATIDGLIGLTQTLDAMGRPISDLSQGLIDAAGGIAALQQGLNFYYQNYYTEAERQAKATADLAAQFSTLGVAMPGTKDAFRALVDGLDLTTASGQTLFAELLRLAPAFNAVANASNRAADSMTGAAERMQQIASEITSVSNFRAGLDTAKFQVASGMAGFDAPAYWQDQIGSLNTRLGEATTTKDKLAIGGELQNAIGSNLQAQMDALSQVHSARMSSLQAEASAAEAAGSAMYSALTQIGDYARGLLTGSLTTLSPEAQMAEAGRQYQSLFSRARGGDAEAAGQLSGASDAYLSAARSYYASGSQYANIFSAVQGELSSLGSSAARYDPAQASYALQQQQYASDAAFQAQITALQQSAIEQYDAMDTQMAKWQEDLQKSLDEEAVQVTSTNEGISIMIGRLGSMPEDIGAVIAAAIERALAAQAQADQAISAAQQATLERIASGQASQTNVLADRLAALERRLAAIETESRLQGAA